MRRHYLRIRIQPCSCRFTIICFNAIASWCLLSDFVEQFDVG
jgi:hypothetical protein